MSFQVKESTVGITVSITVSQSIIQNIRLKQIKVLKLPENALCTTTEGKTECDCDDDVDCADDNNKKICDCQEYRDLCPKMCSCIDKWSTV